jgi:hypothetical protein
LKKALDYVPQSHAALFMLARISFGQEKIPLAKYYLMQAYRINPDDKDTRYFLDRIAQMEANRSFQKTVKTPSPLPPKTMKSSIRPPQSRESL